MKNMKTKIALLIVLAVIGIGLVIAAYFTGTMNGKQNLENPAETPEKGIAIILDLKEQQKEDKSLVNESNAGADDEIFPGEPEILSAQAPIGRGGGVEEEPAAMVTGEDADLKKEDAKEAYLEETIPGMPEKLQNAPPSLESLKRNITSSLNVVVVHDNRVIKNTTVNISNQ